MAENSPQKSRKLKVGVMRGGPSGEYDVSLKTGANILNALRDRHEVRDIFIDKSGKWHIDGLERAPERIFPHIDVVFNALHGEYGEDGRVQQLLDAHGVPYTGSKALPSAIGMNKVLAKKFFKEQGLRTPRHVLVRGGDLDGDSETDSGARKISEIMREIPGTVIVKPVSSGSSLGVTLARNADELRAAISEALKYSPAALVEEYVAGREATCGVVESSTAGEVYALHPIEIKNLSKNKEVWNYDSKYKDELHELICPGNFTPEEQAAIQDYSVRAHKALGLNHYSRSDFMLADDGAIYILETNTLPGLTSSSLFPRALAAADCSVADFLDHVLELAVRER